MKVIKITLLLLLALIITAAASYEKIISGVLLPQYIDWAYETDRKGLEIGTPLAEKEMLLASEVG